LKFKTLFKKLYDYPLLPVTGHTCVDGQVCQHRAEATGVLQHFVTRSELGQRIVWNMCRYSDGPGIESRWGRDFPHPYNRTIPLLPLWAFMARSRANFVIWYMNRNLLEQQPGSLHRPSEDGGSMFPRKISVPTNQITRSHNPEDYNSVYVRAVGARVQDMV
jgi:hypothetical protein